jgi:Tol biopolymer transport system component
MGSVLHLPLRVPARGNLARQRGRIQPRPTHVHERADYSQSHFSTDGRILLFNSRKEGISDLYTIELSSGTLRRLTSHPEEEIQGTWSRDGKYIYFASDSAKAAFWQLQRMPAEGGPWVQIPKNGGLQAQESRDGKTLYFSDDNTLWSLPTADIGSGRANATKLADGLARFSHRPYNRKPPFMA